ncbi:hypothetical protein GCM10009850_038360 [Nonomuraea monospora]|uniref:Uncharacterized protein n=1 Tax=Nonomuraea monospora TaxID=568818 RepID=A0ABN3CHT7_9ACTN
MPQQRLYLLHRQAQDQEQGGGGGAHHVRGELGQFQENFARQVAMIKPLMTWDPPTATWHVRLSTPQAELVSKLINTLLEAARVYGITAAVQVVSGRNDGGGTDAFAGA